MEMVMNEIDPREEPGNLDEQVSGCTMLDKLITFVDIMNRTELPSVCISMLPGLSSLQR